MTNPRTIRSVGLFGKFGDVRYAPVMRELCHALRGRGLRLTVEASTAEVVGEPGVAVLPITEIGRAIDLGIVIGGDGSLLNVARHLAADGVPLIGINVGRLGFLADISRDNMLDVVGRILDGDFATEQRFMLHADILRGGSVVHSSNAVNDVVINKLGLARLIDFETRIDGEFVHAMRADGLIVATPTGSTAYALSAGGPILHPTLEAMILVPVCPHTLSQRPLAIPNTSLVELVIPGSQSAHVTFDGQANYVLHGDETIRVRKATHPITLLHPSDRHHYDVLREKLHWGSL